MSALTDELGLAPLAWDAFRTDASTPGFLSSVLLDASTEKGAFVGRVWHPTVKTGTIKIRKVHFRCGAVTLNAASVFRVSLQNISATAGAPYQPDGTQDQTADLSALTANGWNTTGNLSADRTVDLDVDSFGDTDSPWLCVVFEFQTFTAADSVVVSAFARNGAAVYGMGGAALLNTGSWATVSAGIGNLVLECDDGSFAFIDECTPWAAVGSASVSSTGAIRRAGLKFKFPTQRKIDRFGLWLSIANGSDGRFVLYDSDGTTELVSVDMDNDAIALQGSPFGHIVRFAPVTLAANTFYRLAYVGGSSTNVTVYYGEVNADGHMNGLLMGQNAHWTQADSGGTWTDTTTRRPYFGISTCAVHDGSGGSGGLLTHPGMAGGMRG